MTDEQNKNQRSEELWLDYLENEVEPSLREDVELLLEHSAEDKKRLNDWKLLKSSLRRADPLKNVRGTKVSGPATPNSVPFNSALFEKVMGEVHKTKPVPLWRAKALRPRVIGPVAASLVLLVTSTTLLLRTVGRDSSPAVVAQKADTERWLVEAALTDPGALAHTVNNPQSEQDFVMDALAHQLDNLSDDQVKTAVQELLDE